MLSAYPKWTPVAPLATRYLSPMPMDLSRRSFVAVSAITAATPLVASPLSDREYWLAVLTRIANPVLTALSQKQLKATMPVETSHNTVADRAQYTYLEALGRSNQGNAAAPKEIFANATPISHGSQSARPSIRPLPTT